MEATRGFCAFCRQEEKLTDDGALQICRRCCPRYSQLCRAYKRRASERLLPMGWNTRLVSHCPDSDIFPRDNPPLFYIECRKGPVTVTTAVDRVAFFAAASRLQLDLRPRPKYRRKGKKGAKKSK